jgi:hypothetical protein
VTTPPLCCRVFVKQPGDIFYFQYHAWEKLKSHRSPGIDQIPAELIKAGGRIIRSEIHKLITSI